MRNKSIHSFINRLVESFPFGFQILLYIFVTIMFIEKGVLFGLIILIIEIFFCYFYRIKIWILLILAFFSILQFQEKIESIKLISKFDNKIILLKGEIINYPTIKNSIIKEAKVKVESVDSADIGIGVNVILESSPSLKEYNMLDRISCRGPFHVVKAFEDDYFKSENLSGRIVCDELEIFSSGSSLSVFKPIVDFKRRLVQKTQENLNQPYSDLFLGMVFGDNTQISSQLKNNVRNSGMAHIIAASGYNINLVVSMGFILNKKINRKKLILLSDVLLFFYLLLVGIDNVPAKRAIIMQLYISIAWLFGKKANIFYSFMISILVLFLENIYVYKSLSFLLSFFATLGIIIFFKPLREFLNKFIKDIWLCEAIAISVVSNIATIPILISYFGKISLISVVSNVLMAPFIPLIFYIGFGFLLLVSLGIHSLFLNFVIYSLLDMFVKIVDILGSLKIATIDVESNIMFIIVLIIVMIIVWSIFLYRRKHYE